jgi:nucleoside-diphosphate-sugar epimerase
MKTVVITGSAGFIGGYVVQEALDRGYRVIGIDNLSKYGQAARKFENNPNYHFKKLDAQDSQKMAEIFSEANHIIAGAAMIGGISYFHTYAYDLLATNERIIASTCDAAIQAFRHGVLEKVTYLSSSMVFESTDRWPSKEGDERLVPPPISSYGFQKLAVEYFARAAWDQYKLPYTILRPFNCVGIGEKRAIGDIEIKSGNIALAMSHVVPDLIQKVLKGQSPLHILGNGNQVRCYTYGGDLAQGIIASLENQKTINEDFNLSTSEETTVLQLAEMIWKKIHGSTKNFETISETGFTHDVQRRIPSIDKAKHYFGFEATTSLDKMLDEVIPWVKDAIQKGLI